MTCAALAARSLNITSAEMLFWEEGLYPPPMPYLYMGQAQKFLVVFEYEYKI